jgi:hypothetical protein
MGNVCPDGWKLPKSTDWEKLVSSVRNHYGLPERFELLHLFDLADLGNPLGFGLTARFGYSGPGLAMDPDGKDAEVGDFAITLPVAVEYGYSEPSEWLPVRCIKN